MKNGRTCRTGNIHKNVEGVESQTRRLIAALEQVRTEQLNQLNAAKKAGQSYTTEAANVQALTGQINGLKAGLKELQKEQAAAGATKIDIDTEAVERKTNNLRLQFTQVARELPSLAMGPQMFILAISNNLPMLADAIADVRKQNELLNASGKKAVGEEGCAGMEAAARRMLVMADGTDCRHIGRHHVRKGHRQLGKEFGKGEKRTVGDTEDTGSVEYGAP